MKRIKNYTNIWNAERMVYHINDFVLPRPVPLTQAVSALVFIVLSFPLEGIPPFVTGGFLVDHVAVPAGLSWLLNRRSFDGKKPYLFLKSAAGYFLRRKRRVRNHTVVLGKRKLYGVCVTMCEGGAGDVSG